ncbi:hypothetical protein EXU00_25295 [Klebsiella pneumoniae]|nr:hypothetical protein C7235_26795 [Escherichia coli]PQM85253.1 hypothetical protein C5673_27540 [Klebsiella quasipneumoniae]TBO61730.1 hypothetical protein EQG46_26565 [Klebsiella pneumoniae]MQJ00739.1 hypothetical protein [Escherichia coli]NYS59068.1 hypothetical protein [Escherichia coli]
MGSCAAPSAKGDDKFITTDYLQQCLKIDHTERKTTGVVGKAERLTWHKAWTMVSTGFSISYT